MNPTVIDGNLFNLLITNGTIGDQRVGVKAVDFLPIETGIAIRISFVRVRFRITFCSV